MPPAVYSYLRFSTPEQLKGDSLRRQLERSRQWCKEHGLTLNDSLTMRDLGLSAYHGTHKTKGALGLFLKAVESGTIQPGSILLVESLDRLSRQDVVDAQTQFLNIINAGIEIVTLMDGYRYSRESIKENWTQLIISLTIMSRANEESKTKADRLNATWQNKRNNLDKRKLTATCPAWLRLNKKLQIFEPITERVEAVQRIFSEYIEGRGVYAITKRLNDDKVPTFGCAKAWGKSSVQKILKNRSVLGEFQPHSRKIFDGKRQRIPEGQPIQNYYPRIINDEVFNAVQARMAANVGKGGRVGFVNNLFQHTAFCGDCGSKFGFVRKQRGKYQYLRCGSSVAGRGCNSAPWPYADFESAFLSQCTELDVASILPAGNGRAKKIKDAELNLDSVQGQLAEIEKTIDRIKKILLLETNDDAVIKMYLAEQSKALIHKTDLEKRLLEAQTALSVAQSETVSTSEQLKSIKELIAKLNTTDGDKRIELRKRLQSAIKKLVDRIVIYPQGMGDKILLGDFSDHDVLSIRDELDVIENPEHKALIDEHIKANSGKSNRAFIIYFKSGGYRLCKQDGGEYVNVVSTWDGLKKIVHKSEVIGELEVPARNTW